MRVIPCDRIETEFHSLGYGDVFRTDGRLVFMKIGAAEVRGIHVFLDAGCADPIGVNAVRLCDGFLCHFNRGSQVSRLDGAFIEEAKPE